MSNSRHEEEAREGKVKRVEHEAWGGGEEKWGGRSLETVECKADWCLQRGLSGTVCPSRMTAATHQSSLLVFTFIQDPSLFTSSPSQTISEVGTTLELGSEIPIKWKASLYHLTPEQ